MDTSCQSSEMFTNQIRKAVSVSSMLNGKSDISSSFRLYMIL